MEELLRMECIVEKMRLYGYVVPTTEELKIRQGVSGGQLRQAASSEEKS